MSDQLSVPPVPPDVQAWVEETYRPEGVRIWLSAWARADDERRALMVQAARTPECGT
jgi:hypothetical protein